MGRGLVLFFPLTIELSAPVALQLYVLEMIPVLFFIIYFLFPFVGIRFCWIHRTYVPWDLSGSVGFFPISQNLILEQKVIQ